MKITDAEKELVCIVTECALLVGLNPEFYPTRGGYLGCRLYPYGGKSIKNAALHLKDILLDRNLKDKSIELSNKINHSDIAKSKEVMTA